MSSCVPDVHISVDIVVVSVHGRRFFVLVSWVLARKVLDIVQPTVLVVERTLILLDRSATPSHVSSCAPDVSRYCGALINHSSTVLIR